MGWDSGEGIGISNMMQIFEATQASLHGGQAGAWGMV